MDISSVLTENQPCIQEMTAMALAQIIDLEERRRARTTTTPATTMPVAAAAPLWCYVWMPVYFWYVA